MGVGMVLKVGRLRASSIQPPETANGDAEGVDGFSPSPTRGRVWGKFFLEINVRIGEFWSANHS